MATFRFDDALDAPVNQITHTIGALAVLLADMHQVEDHETAHDTLNALDSLANALGHLTTFDHGREVYATALAAVGLGGDEPDGPCPDDPDGLHHVGCGC